MISAWVLYYDYESNKYQFEVRDGTALEATEPEAWGLNADQHEVLLVLQNAQFVGAWLEGSRVKGS